MNVLFIDIDTLRPDHMGCYGYGRNTTPNIDAIAKEGVRFDNYYCSDAPCLPSRAALVSGTFGIKNGVVGHGGTAADRFREGITRDFRDNRDIWNFHNIFAQFFVELFQQNVLYVVAEFFLEIEIVSFSRFLINNFSANP